MELVPAQVLQTVSLKLWKSRDVNGRRLSLVDASVYLLLLILSDESGKLPDPGITYIAQKLGEVSPLKIQNSLNTLNRARLISFFQESSGYVIQIV